MSTASAPTDYQGLLVDWGGVMTMSVFDAFEAFGEEEGIGRGAVVAVFGEPKARELLVGLETGTLPEADFEAGLAALLGVAPDGLIVRMLGRVEPDLRMRRAVAAACALGVRTGMISNSWGGATYPPEIADLFDGHVISGDVGIRKPSRAIYELGAERIGLRPDQCVFVDDLPQNLVPARDLGMGTIHHRDADSTVAELARLLGIDL